MEILLNILGLFFLASGVVAWGFLLLVGVFYWMCQQSPKDEL
jgi:hypothetical protein